RLRVLVAIAAPEDVESYQVGPAGRALAAVNAKEERAHVEGVLAQYQGRLALTFLDGPGEATLGRLALHGGEGCDVLYLVCHGALAGTEPILYLVNKDKNTAPTPGKDLVAEVRQWASQPFVIVLSSCQSAGRAQDEEARLDEFDTLAALGPR